MKNLIKSLVLITAFTSIPMLAKHKQSTTKTQTIMGCDQAGNSNGGTGTYNQRKHTASVTVNSTTVQYNNVHRYKGKNTMKFAYVKPKSKKSSSKRYNKRTTKKTYLYGSPLLK